MDEWAWVQTDGRCLDCDRGMTRWGRCGPERSVHRWRRGGVAGHRTRMRRLWGFSAL